MLAVSVGLAAGAASGGCYAHRMPVVGSLAAAEAQLLTSGPLPFTVSIVAWNAEPGDTSGRDPNEYARALADLVEDSQAFKASRFETTLGASAELVAISTGLTCEISAIPLFTILTAGIIPAVFDAERCDGMILRSPKPGSAPPIEIRVQHKGQVVVGWAALALGALRGWSYGVIGDDREYRKLFRIEVAKRGPEIEKLATGVPPVAALTPQPEPVAK